jgi:hypothetical protein
MSSGKLHIYFRKCDVREDCSYYYFPSSAMDSPFSNLTIPLVPELSKGMDALRDSMKLVFKGVGEHSEILASEVNRCFYWVFWPLFRDIQVLQAFIRTHGFVEFVIHGGVVNGYSAIANRGDEARPFLYFPDFFYPKWVVPALPKHCKIHFKAFSLRLIQFYMTTPFRNGFTLFGKVALMCVQRFHFLLSMRLKKPVRKPMDYLLLARGLVSIEFFEKLDQMLSMQNKRGAIFLNLSPRQAFSSSAVYRRVDENSTHILDASQYSSFGLILSCLQRLFKSSYCARAILSDNVNSIQIDFLPIIKELECAYPDTYIHQTLIARALVGSPKALVLSTELVSEYTYFEEMAAKLSGARYYTAQAFSLAASDAVNLVMGEGIIVQDEILRNEIVKIFPDMRERVFYLGNITYREHAQIASCLRRIIYFSQPYDFENQREILRNIFSTLERLDHNVEFIVKLHPRDSADNYNGIKNLQFIKSGCASNESLITESDFVVSRCSSVLHDALMLGVPYIACTFTQYEKEFSPPYLADELGVRVSNYGELEDRMVNFEQYQYDFSRRRSSCLDKVAKPFDLQALCNL